MRASPKVAIFYTTIHIHTHTTFRQALNRALLLMQDFEFSNNPADSGWVLLTSNQLPAQPPPSTALPLSEISNSDFAGMSLVETNAFVRSHSDVLAAQRLSAMNWAVIDQKGLETSTCLIFAQYYNTGEDGGAEGMTDKFRACRIPYEKAHLMIVNLNLANMGFEDFVNQAAGVQEDGSWKWQSFASRTTKEGPTEVEIKRDRALKELRDSGHAD
ncbi:hypothetical protein FB451DRAFT_1409727 [Mycena latifolia]|nr:hypothetical protein FB451DRAFT_1409727 [Mycena latifolia]